WRIDRARRAMITRISNVEPRREERSLNLADRFEIGLRQRYAVALNLLANFLQRLIKQFWVRGGAVDVLDKLLDTFGFPSFGFRQRLAEERAQILDSIARPREQGLEQ